MPDTCNYPAEIERDEDDRFVVGFPDFGWGATDGATRDEALDGFVEIKAITPYSSGKHPKTPEDGAMSITLTVTAKGQITLRKEVLRHLGVRPGDRLDVDLLGERRLQLRPKRGTSPAAVFGMLARPGGPRLSIEEMNEAAASGWAGEP